MDIAARLRFDPAAAASIRTPDGTGYGHWVGGRVSHDPESGLFTLFYRVRRPLEAGRGGRCAVAVGSDGVTFEDVWTATKEEFAAASIEEGHCVRHADGDWRLYVSYERHGAWRIDVVRGPDPARLDTQGRRTVLAPGDYGLAWIKDPFVLRRGGAYHLYAAVPDRTGPRSEGNVIHAAPLDATVLAESADGLYFPTIEYVFEAPGTDTWDGRRARLNSVFPWDGAWAATYDGGRTFYDNYEEWAGLAHSPDGRRFTRVDTGGPWIRSSHGCVRYVQVEPVGDRFFCYFEYTREDGSHDLRVAVVER